MYDVIVVGARAAGAPAAMLFARSGHRVLLLERSVFPADTLSTLYIQQPGVARLARWGLLDAVRATGCPPLDRVLYEVGGVRVTGCSSGIDGIREAYAPRRYLLDRILVEGAVAAGAEFRDGSEVTGLVHDGDRVAGVRWNGPDGAVHTERAHLVVGADGMRSTVARLVGAAKQVEHPALTCAYYTFWQGPRTDFEMYEGPTGWIAAVPTNDATLIAAYHPQHRFDEVRRDAMNAYLESVRVNAPALHAQLDDAERMERLYGTGDQQNYFRTATGPGWVLIGDAGHHKDSLTAQGIGDALMQAELLVEGVREHVGDPVAQAAALSAFATERDARLGGPFQATLGVAQADAQGRRIALLRAVSTSPELTQRYFDTLSGVVPLDGLYTPELLRLMQEVAATG
ncbi:NAD(P)/FAD-dependent oxidoreductase [Streptomyces canus]|uniref:2-polyprenyl-6-methoxyphenol hydroxylase-like FAD-dependent oxidoreductase n=1 Tax=Streptomyces canus TaxID=58343 RepID=A0AAW8FS73_9ACTN|nr:FAD-dependent monooxygenase [Streptomyces canus]MDQ0912423.1 2-polyprenyl-6-methoxyphenol hydroxylase-like FAD-dependent oxidoreductase [Streptomyces canus]MDQ1072410.1 2-polyprenyl-6-methoxyphenol hydroxylase-like FAD-dependent oxidoreductase [Streptomyces canus]